MYVAVANDLFVVVAVVVAVTVAVAVAWAVAVHSTFDIFVVVETT